ncbi:MAG: cytochrome c5 family protein [Betaproteobacteria bacterium]|nr:cytochrome c5 family protein [Betaproteobacteria bacterium]
MSHDNEMSPTTPRQFSLALLGGLLAPLVAILLIIGYAVAIQGEQTDANTADAQDREVRARIQPYGTSLAIDPNVPHVDRTGEVVYTEVCASCHGSGAIGSPKFKDAGAWAKRNAQGYNTLLTHALKGFNKMPARGGDADLTDQEVANAVVYMTNAVGSKFAAVLQQERIPSAGELAKGKAVYDKECATCHASGMTGAQKLNDVAAWKPLIKGGMEALYLSAVNGTNTAPAKGGNLKLSDADARLATDYMVSEAKAAIAKAAATKPVTKPATQPATKPATKPAEKTSEKK